MQSTIEGFTLPPSPLDAKSRPGGHGTYPDAFFVALAVALESSEQFVNALKAVSIQLTPAEIRDMLRHGEAYLPFADALERFTRGIRHTVFSRRAKVGRVASFSVSDRAGHEPARGCLAACAAGGVDETSLRSAPPEAGL